MRLWPIRNNKRKTESTSFNLNLFFFFLCPVLLNPSWRNRLESKTRKFFLKVFLTLQLKSHFVFFFLPVRALLLIARSFVVAFQFSISSPRKHKKKRFFMFRNVLWHEKGTTNKSMRSATLICCKSLFRCATLCKQLVNICERNPTENNEAKCDAMCASVLRIHCSNYQRLSKGKKSLQFSNLFKKNASSHHKVNNGRICLDAVAPFREVALCFDFPSISICLHIICRIERKECIERSATLKLMIKSWA